MTHALLALLLMSATTAPATPVYRCARAEHAITIDGKLDDGEWSAAAWTEDFADLRGRYKPPPRLRTRAKMLWDDEFLYIAAEMSDPDVRARLRERDAALHTDGAFEIFIDPDGDAQRYLELQINPHNAVLDLLMSRPYRARGKADRSFTLMKLKSAVQVHGTLNDSGNRDEGWSAELAIPIDEIAQLAPADASPRAGVRWQLNLARVWREHDSEDGTYSAWAPPGEINLHIPSRWGWIEFIDRE